MSNEQKNTGANPVDENAKPHNPGLSGGTTEPPSSLADKSSVESDHGKSSHGETGRSGGLPSDVEADPSQQPG